MHGLRVCTVTPPGGGPIAVEIDIKPGDCENIIRIPRKNADKGRIKLAVLGSAECDVTRIDLESLRLEGVIPIHTDINDIATHSCDVSGPDGYLDIVAHFSAAEVLASVGDVEGGTSLDLVLNGNMLSEYGGKVIRGEDSVTIVFVGKYGSSGQ